MATLDQLTLDADGAIDTANIEHDGGTGSPYFSHCNDAPDGVSSDFVQNDDGEMSGEAWFSLSNVNADFASMDTLNIDVDVQAVGFSNDTCTLTARVFAADDDTANPLTAETGNLGTDADGSRVQRNVVFGTLAGTKAQWDAAHVRFTWTYNKTGGPDNANLQLFGCDIDGTYTVVAPVVTAVGDGSEPDKKQDVVITGTNFGASDTGSAQVEITDNAVYGAGTFEIIVPRDSWTATSIQVDLQETGTGNPLLDDLTAGTVWCYVTDSGGLRSPGFAFTLKEQGATWIAAKNIDWTQAVDVNFRLRIEIKNTGAAATTPAFKWQYNHEAGGWNDITASSSVVQTVGSVHFVDGDDLVEQLLGSDTFITNNDAAEETTGTFTMGGNLGGSEVIETEASLTIVSGDVVDLDTIDLRIVESDGTAFGTYTQTVTITVTEAAGSAIVVALETDTVPLALAWSKSKALGVAGETDAAGALGADKARVLGIGLEVDSAFVLAWAKAKALGIAPETDSAFVLGAERLELIGFAGETDTAFVVVGVTSQNISIGAALEDDIVPLALAWAKAKGVGIAPEADAAFVVGAGRLEVIGVVGETDSGVAVAVVKLRLIGVAPELDTAFVLTWARAKGIGIALETDTPIVLGRDKARAIALGGEADSAFVLGHSKQKLIGAAPETDAALLLVTGLTRAIGAAGETDVPLAITHAKALLLGIAGEDDTAFVLGSDLGGVIVTDWLIPIYRRRRR